MRTRLSVVAIRTRLASGPACKNAGLGLPPDLLSLGAGGAGELSGGVRSGGPTEEVVTDDEVQLEALAGLGQGRARVLQSEERARSPACRRIRVC